MTSPPDKLFRQGLEDYHKPAPGSAWDRIESGLERKRNRGLWMKVAAGLVLLITTSAVILQFNQAETTLATTSKEPTTVTLNPDSALTAVTELQEIGDRRQETVDSEHLPVSSLKSLSSNSIVERSRNEPQSKSPRSSVSRSNCSVDPAKFKEFAAGPQPAVAIQTSTTPDASNQAWTAKPDETSIEHTSITQEEISKEISMTETALDSRRTSITYTAEEVNAKYLKKESTAEATPEKKNTSGLQKVIDLALDLKNEGSVLGDIRDIKNEFLSINIPSNRRETNK